MPWMKEKLHARKERREVRASAVVGSQEGNATAISNDVQLNNLPSSTSVFRTPSSVIRRSRDGSVDMR